jgi:hypothetical protein
MSANLPSLDLTELRFAVGGAERSASGARSTPEWECGSIERASRRATVAQAMQSLRRTGSVSNWLDRTMFTKYGLINCACGCGLSNCR